MPQQRQKKEKNSLQHAQLKHEVLSEIYAIILFTVSFIAMARYGAIGRNLTYLSRFIVGTFDFLIPILGMGIAVYIMVKREWPNKWSPRLTGILLFLCAILTYNHLLTFQALGMLEHQHILDKTWDLLLKERDSPVPTDIGSGMVGAVMYALLYFLFDNTGTLIVLGALMLSGLLLLTGFSYVTFFHRIRDSLSQRRGQLKEVVTSYLQNTYSEKSEKSEKKITTEKEEAPVNTKQQNPSVSQAPLQRPVIHDFQEKAYQSAQGGMKEQLALPIDKMNEETDVNVEVDFQTKQDMSHYIMPSLQLLEKSKKRKSGDRENIKANADVLVKTLQSFGVHTKVTDIHRGPTVTRYEVQPEIGVKVSRIVNLADDIALALAAKDIRIEAPIPGKSAVGVEVPNTEVSMVHLRDVLESGSYQSSSSKLTISLGMDISGEPIVDNLIKMPHLLVAGATGSGKSVCINGIIVNLLYKAKPDEVKLMMIDPKMVELNIYNGIPHLLAPVVTDPRKAAVALKKIVAEMEKRYKAFAANGARDIERYNTMVREQGADGQLVLLPYIVVIVDELADLMMVAPADVEDAICRLAQMARAAGIHLIIATQRPSVDVITGVIKANIPSRIAFAVSSSVDSRTILDMGGAEKLLGHGDMLYLPVGASKPIRIQGAYVADEEVERVVSFVKDQQEASYNEEMIPTSNEMQVRDVLDDELYPQAVQIVLEAKTASVSFIQRRLRVGYTRAARLMDIMEANGIVGPYEGSKPREVLVTLEQFQEKNSMAK